MLTDTLTAAIREVGEANGGALLLDANSGRAILTDAKFAFDLCRNLKRAGFTQFVDFTGIHHGGAGLRARQDSAKIQDAGTETRATNADTFTLYLTLRAPEHAHARLTLKWKW